MLYLTRREEIYMWFEERYDGVSIRLKGKKLFEKRSPFHLIEVYETEKFGRLLALDGTVQLTEKDEFIYHEILTHVALFSHPNPRDVLIIGGGDGGIARECLRHGVKVTLVEVDPDVIEISKLYFPKMARALARVELHIMDGFNYLRNVRKGFDVIIVDSTDPVGVARKLFTKKFYSLAKAHLNSNGILAVQLGSFWYHSTHIRRSLRSLMKTFKEVRVFRATIPTYPGGLWIFSLASERRISRRRRCNLKTKYYSDELYDASFVLPKLVKNVLGV